MAGNFVTLHGGPHDGRRYLFPADVDGAGVARIYIAPANPFADGADGHYLVYRRDAAGNWVYEPPQDRG